jgi:plastocyanin
MRIGIKGLGVALVCCLVQARAAHATFVVPWQTTLTDRLQEQAQAQTPTFTVRLQAHAPAPAAQPANTVFVIDNGGTSGFFDPDPVNISVGDTVIWYDDGFGPNDGSYLISSADNSWTPFYTPGGITFDFPGTYDYYDDIGDLGEVMVASIPEPSTLLLASLSALGLGVFLKRARTRGRTIVS